MEIWIQEVNEQLRKLFLLSLWDTGYSPQKFHEMYGDMEPREAAIVYGEDYGLQRIDGQWQC